MTDRENRILARLAKLHARRDAKAAEVAKLNEQIDAARRELADARGVSFIRRETIRTEIAANG